MRTRNGSSVLLCAIALFAIAPLGFLTVEIWRYVSAKSQLQYICDAAALSATASLLRVHLAPNQVISSANSSPDSIITLETEAVDAGILMFQKNSVLGTPLSKIVTAINSPLPKTKPKAGQIFLSLQLLDCEQRQLNFGDRGAKGMRLTALYGYAPLSGRYLGLGIAPIAVSSEGGIPPIDLVLCFDVSASMDDGTAVSACKRFWNGNAVSYNVPSGGQGALSDVVKPKEEGSKVNAVGPQNLSCLSLPLNSCILFFSESALSPIKGLRALLGPGINNEVGRPPGNYDPNNPSSRTGNGLNPDSSPDGVTDLVTNLDGQANFAGWTDPASGLEFPNIETLVEASRGNLNSQANMQQALNGRPAWLPATAPDQRYQTVYFSQANRMLQPMLSAKTAAIQLVRALDRSTDLHCGLVTFADDIGSAPDSTWAPGPFGTTYFIDSHWPAGGTATYPLPLLKLQSNPANTVGFLPNWDRWLCPPAYAQAPPPVPPANQTIVQLISSLVVTGRSNIAAALQEATLELTDLSRSRTDAEKIILLISDGEPDLPGGGGGINSPAAVACYNQATIARRNGIKIVSIDVATSTDVNHSLFLSKVASLSRNGFYMAGTSTNQITLALTKILTQLVSLK